MINFDSLTLRALLTEIEPILISGRIHKVQQPSRDEFLFSIRSGGENYKLFISVNPKYPHLNILTEQGEACRNIEIPQRPPMFCMLLRKYMEGAKIRAIIQPEYERILEIYFDSYNELGAKVPLVLSSEFMGKHSNIILYNYENNVILGSAHKVGPEKSREREVAAGLPYIYPPKSKKLDLLQISETQFYELAKSTPSPMNTWLNENFHYISLALATEMCKVAEVNIEKDKILAIKKNRIIDLYKLAVKTLRLENLNPSISKDKKFFSIIGLDPDIIWKRCNSVNIMTDVYFGYQEHTDKLSRAKSSLFAIVKRELKKQKTKLSLHQKNLESEEKAEKYKQYADIIMLNLPKMRPGQETLEAENYFENYQVISIPLDPAKNPVTNAQRYYKLYNKAKSAAKVSLRLIGDIKDEVDYLEGIELSINQADSFSELRQIKDELISQNIIKAIQKPQKQREKAKIEEIKLTQYNSSDNYKILVGRNNKQNDYLISKIASQNDIWLHTQNIPGSHVLIKLLPGEIDVPERTILEAANIAAYYSQAKNSSNVPVVFVRRKYIKKPPGAKPGYVTFTNEKTLIITPDENLVNNLG